MFRWWAVGPMCGVRRMGLVLGCQGIRLLAEWWMCWFLAPADGWVV